MDSQTKIALLTLLSGLLFGVGWWLLIDAAVYAEQTDDKQQVTFPFVLLGLVSTSALILLNVFPWSALSNMDSIYTARAKVALFISLSLLLGCVLGAIWILAAVYAPDRNRADSSWPGAAILLQQIFIAAAALTMRYARTIDVY